MRKVETILPDRESIGQIRLLSQHIAGTRVKTVKALVSWMGAIQAQDLQSALLAMAIRIQGVDMQMLHKAFADGEIIRTHILRPTWHIVAAEDYRAFMKLTGPYIRSALRYRRADAGIDDTLFAKAGPPLNEMLSNGNHLTREQIAEELSTVIKDLDSTKMNHILLENELDCTICSGRIINKQGTYALVSEMLKDLGETESAGSEELLKRMAVKYFKSHGPATLADFNWWSGLPAGECRKALELAKSELISFTDDKTVYWYDPDVLLEQNPDLRTSLMPSLVLLPAFDEFIIAYKDRSMVMTPDIHTAAISSNGIFKPVVVYEGLVAGIWSKKTTVKKTTIDIKWFMRPGGVTEAGIEQAKNTIAKHCY